MASPITAISFKLPTALAERLDVVARARLLSRSDVIRGALLVALDREQAHGRADGRALA